MTNIGCEIRTKCDKYNASVAGTVNEDEIHKVTYKDEKDKVAKSYTKLHQNIQLFSFLQKIVAKNH